MKFLYPLLLPILTALALGTFSSCRPDDPPKLIVYAVDSTGVKVAGALIQISSQGTGVNANVPGIVKDQGTTDGSGQVTFEEFKLDAVVRIDGTKSIGGGDSLRGTVNAKLITGETTEATVLLKR